MLTTVFATSRDPLTFTTSTNFEVGSITAVVDNCATATVLNNKTLFIDKLVHTQEYSLVTVGGSDHKPTHYGPAEISVRNDNGDIVTIPIPKALYYPSSPVNVLSIGQMSMH